MVPCSVICILYMDLHQASNQSKKPIKINKSVPLFINYWESSLRCLAALQRARHLIWQILGNIPEVWSLSTCFDYQCASLQRCNISMIQLQEDLEIIGFKLALYCCVGSKNEKWESDHFFDYPYTLFTGQNSYHFLLTCCLKRNFFFQVTRGYFKLRTIHNFMFE